MRTDKATLAKMIDHAVLHPAADDNDVRAGADIALRYDVASLCVRPTDLPFARQLLSGSSVALSTVIGFPHGSHSPDSKLAEARYALEAGAVELDCVMNVSRLISGDNEFVAKELNQLSALVHEHDQRLKIILETCYLTDEQIIQACELCNEAAVDWVKTSTGFGTHGAKESHVKLMRQYANDHIHVKASGGIRDLDSLLIYRELGCNRIGTSSTIAILDRIEADDTSTY